MSDHRTRSGARLRTDSRVVTARSRTMACEGDYTIRRCVICGKRFEFFRQDHILVCSKKCDSTSDRRKAGVPIGRATKWRELYAAARAAAGQWVVHTCPDLITAERLVINIGQRRDFEAFRIESNVSVRLVVAA